MIIRIHIVLPEKTPWATWMHLLYKIVAGIIDAIAAANEWDFNFC